MSYTVTSSRNVNMRNKKIILWGGPGSRKTETVLRNFPNVLLIDSEGNSDQCVDVPEIPEFLQVKTKDVEVARQILVDVGTSKAKMPDGQLIETVCIDSETLLWWVRQEFGANVAESRAVRYNRSKDEANMTQADWNISKRPLKEFHTSLANCPVRYIVLIGREKDQYVQRPGSSKPDDKIKVGVEADLMKGTDYEANLSFRFGYEDILAENQAPKPGPWFCEVTKVQGSLGKELAKGKRFKEFPWSIIQKHSQVLKPSVGAETSDAGTGRAGAEALESASKTEEWTKAEAGVKRKRFELEAQSITPSWKKVFTDAKLGYDPDKEAELLELLRKSVA